MIHSFLNNMAEIKALPATILLLFLISLFHIPKAVSKPTGFSLKLIRSYPPKSLNHRNTTFLERYKSYLRASEARAFYWTSFTATGNKTIQPDAIQPPLTKELLRIVVEMRIGTPAQQVFLQFDTGGKLSWTQCAFCATCYPQSVAKFDPRHSTSFRVMASDDPNCKPPEYLRERPCRYRVSYLNGQYSNGIASYDTFASMDNNPDQTAASIRFGCSVEAAGFKYPPSTVISGILGMSRSEESLPAQLNQYGGKGRFSYCLVDINTAPNVANRVTFGDDIPDTPGQNLATVPFIEHAMSHSWAINLIDVSVGQERLNLPQGTFAPNPYGGNGGLILDTGSPLTFIARDVYLAIKSKIQNHLSRTGDFTEIPRHLDLCYRYNGPPGQLPMTYLQTITFHLENEADLVMPVTSVYGFDRARSKFCLGMSPAQSNWPNILGAHQQQDTRFIYDINENSLFFIPELCAGNQA